MNRNKLLLIAAAFTLIVAALFINDGWIYLVAGLTAIIIVALIRRFKPWVMKITRWSKENPRKTQVFITVLQVLILSLGLLVGYDLHKLGYQLSSTPTVVFGIILATGFFSIRFLPRRNTIAIPAVVNKDRMFYLSVVLSGYVLMVITGNRIEDKFPNSPLSLALRSVDGAIFSIDMPADEIDGANRNAGQPQTMLMNGNASMLAFTSVAVTGEKSVTSTIHPENEVSEKIKPGKKAERMEKKQKKMMKRIESLRKAFAAGASAGSIFLIIVLIAATCAGICLIVTGGTAGAVILGIIITAGAIFGIVKLAQKKKRAKQEQ